MARLGRVLLVVAESADEPSRAALVEACRAGDPEAELARIVSARGAVTPAFCAGVFSEADLALFLHGPVEVVATVPGSRFDIALTSGDGWRQDRLNGLPQSLRVTTAPGAAGAGSPLHDLVEGIVPGTGLSLVARASAVEAVAEPEAVPEPEVVVAAEAAPTAEPVVAAAPAAPADASGDHTMVLSAIPAGEDARVCGNGHANPAGATQCQVCGMRLHDAGAAPALGRLVGKDGLVVVVDRPLLIGRGTAEAPEVHSGEFAALVIPDGEAGVSRVHAEIRVDGWSAFLADRGSANGTFIQPPGTAEWIRLEVGHAVAIVPGVKIAVGPYELSFEPA